MWSYYQYRKLAAATKLEIEEHGDRNGHINFADTARDKHHSRRRRQEDRKKGVVSEQTPLLDEEDTTNDAEDGDDNEGENNDGQTGDSSSQASNDSEDKRFKVRTWGDDDDFDPRNWPLLERSKNIAILAFLIFVQAWAGAGSSQANLPISQEFGVSQVAENLSTAMYLFGIGAGSMFAGPLSETFGRNPAYLGGTFAFMLFQLGCTQVTNLRGQIICRFFIGVSCSATLAINGGSVRDQFRSVKRSFVFPVIAWVNVAAPMIAPIAGGWIVENPKLSWRWTEYVTLIISLFAFLIALLFLPETHLPTLLKWKATHLRELTGNDRYQPEDDEGSFLDQMKSVGSLPVKFWLTEPVVAIFGIYLVLLYILLFSFLSGFDYIFKKTYDLSPGYTGSCFGASALGATAFTLLAPGLYTAAREKTEHVRKRPLSPEFRLWPAIIAGPLLSAALFCLGWTARPDITIWSPLAACFVFGGCLCAIYVSTYEYIIDSYGESSSIALASITFVRYLVAGGMAIAARPMFMNIGVPWTMTGLGIVAAILSPAPFVFWWIGGTLRNKSPYAAGDDER